jgi:hypothetical protein
MARFRGKRVRRNIRFESEQATRREKYGQVIHSPRISARRARRIAERNRALQGEMNNWDGSYAPISHFPDNSMRRDYQVGYRV